MPACRQNPSKPLRRGCRLVPFNDANRFPGKGDILGSKTVNVYRITHANVLLWVDLVDEGVDLSIGKQRRRTARM